LAQAQALQAQVAQAQMLAQAQVRKLRWKQLEGLEVGSEMLEAWGMFCWFP